MLTPQVDNASCLVHPSVKDQAADQDLENGLQDAMRACMTMHVPAQTPLAPRQPLAATPSSHQLNDCPVATHLSPGRGAGQRTGPAGGAGGGGGSPWRASQPPPAPEGPGGPCTRIWP